MREPRPTRRPAPFLACILLGALVAVLLAAGAGRAADYLLGPQDQVRLKIFEWRASRDTIFEWTALNDTFTVGPEGNLSLPFVGVIAAADRTATELAARISERLVYQMRLGHAPDVSVEIVGFRPFYIVGHVNAPGEFAFRPAMTVLQAVSIAGGLRSGADGLDRLDREIISGRGEVGLITIERANLLALRARLEAELGGQDAVATPPELAGHADDPIIAHILEQERTIFEARRDGLEAQLKALHDLRGFLERESESLRQQVGFLDAQIATLQTELGTVTSLVDQGLAVAPRQLALERDLLGAQSSRLAAETAHLRAKQEISRTEISISELGSQRRTDASTALRDAQASLDALESRSDTTLLLLEESLGFAPRLRALRAEAAASEPRFTIVRPGPEGVVEIEAAESTSVLPGDTVKVELPFLTAAGMDAVAPSSAGSGASGAALDASLLQRTSAP